MIAQPTRLPRWVKTLVVLVAVILALVCFILVLNQVAAGRASADRERQDLIAIAARDRALSAMQAQSKANGQQLLLLTGLVKDQSAQIGALRKQLAKAGIKPVDLVTTKSSGASSGASDDSGRVSTSSGSAPVTGSNSGGTTGKPKPKPSPSPKPLPQPAPSPADTGVCVLIICVK